MRFALRGIRNIVMVSECFWGLTRLSTTTDEHHPTASGSSEAALQTAVYDLRCDGKIREELSDPFPVHSLYFYEASECDSYISLIVLSHARTTTDPAPNERPTSEFFSDLGENPSQHLTSRLL